MGRFRQCGKFILSKALEHQNLEYIILIFGYITESIITRLIICLIHTRNTLGKR